MSRPAGREALDGIKMQATGDSSVRVVTAWSGATRHAAALAGVALLNPYTLFGLDAGPYWLATLLMPPLLAAAYLGVRALLSRPAAAREGLSFIRLSAMLQVLMLAAQWADV
jgi:hypothetical protein